MSAGAPAARQAPHGGPAQGGSARGGAALRRGPRRVHRRQVLHAPEWLPVADAQGKRGSAPRRPGGARGRKLCRLRALRRGRARGRALPVLLRGARGAESPRMGEGTRRGPPSRHRISATGMSVARRPVSILVAALGGQGGGVLTEWIVAAAEHAGLPVQATSIPG